MPLIRQQHESSARNTLDPEGKIIELPIAYLSAQFSDTQFKWSTVVKEGYAIYYCIKKWRPYLEDAEILLKK